MNALENLAQLTGEDSRANVTIDYLPGPPRSRDLPWRCVIELPELDEWGEGTGRSLAEAVEDCLRDARADA